MTKRNVIENLTYPLLEISVGLNILLASVNKEAVMDVEGKNNLSRLALACNTAINALDDMAYEDECLFSHLDLGTPSSGSCDDISHQIKLSTPSKLTVSHLLSIFRHE